jgi:hypothetical protein
MAADPLPSLIAAGFTPEEADLIQRLESAEEPSRELDYAIQLAIGVVQMPLSVDRFDRCWVTIEDGKPVQAGPDVLSTRDHYLPGYTYSIESALMLVPDGWNWAAFGGSDLPPAAQLTTGEPPYFDDCEEHVTAATTSLALCAAALRARLRAAGGGQ